jgi:DNA (cytosine-5)-methyltransferase 1
MAFPDALDRPSRTVITSEGGTTATRTKHAIRESSGLLRRLTPEELEALNGFPRGFTALPGVSDTTRAMLMGNALITPLVTRIGEALYKAHVRCANAG